MKPVIEPVSLELIKAELTPARKLIDTNKGGNELYVVSWQDSPNVVREIGRLREVTFRQAGASSGLEMDLDEFDTMEKPYRQLVVWDPDAEAIIGGYRFILGPDVQFTEDGQPKLASAHMFHFSESFIKNYLPHTMELGRSFVAPDYQSSKAGAKAIFAMDNLWDGIASVILSHPSIIHMFGKMTFYPSYDKTAFDLIMHFLWKHFEDKEELVRAYDPVLGHTDPRLMDMILTKDDFKPDFRCLKGAVGQLGTQIPPLVNSYMNTSESMKMFGTAVNHEFGEAIETAIMINFNEIRADKIERHVLSFENGYFARLKERFPKIGPDVMEKLRINRDKHRLQHFKEFLTKIMK